MYKKFDDMYQLSVELKDGSWGMMNLSELDYSYGDEGRIRFTADGLVTVEIQVDLNTLWYNLLTKVEMRVVYSDITEEEVEDSIYHGAHLVLCESFCEELWEGLCENGCVHSTPIDNDPVVMIGKRMDILRMNLHDLRIRNDHWDKKEGGCVDPEYTASLVMMCEMERQMGVIKEYVSNKEYNEAIGQLDLCERLYWVGRYLSECYDI